MDTTILISVIVPVYNAAQFLPRCVDSILNQDHTDFELLLIDDGSSDDSAQICDAYAKKDNRVQVTHQSNRGVSAARNVGLRAAKGDYIAFVDADDWIESDMLSFLLSQAQAKNTDVVRCGYFTELADGHRASSEVSDDVSFPQPDTALAELAVSGTAGVLWNKLYRRNVLKNVYFDEQFTCSEDLLFNYHVYKNAARFVFCSQPKYHYLINPSSITNSAFSDGAFDVLRVKKYMMQQEESNTPVYRQILIGYVLSAFIVLSGAARRSSDPQDFVRLRKDLLTYKFNVLCGHAFGMREKVKMLLLWLAPGLYKKIIAKVKEL